MDSIRASSRYAGYGLTIVLLSLLCIGCTDLKRFAYEGFNRDAWQEPQRVVRALDLRSGDDVADLGSGSGYFTFHLADAVGPSGKVYAVDVDRGLNAYVAKRAREKGYQNIAVILAEQNDPRLPESGIDLIFTCNTYHHLDDRIAYFANARDYLRAGGRVAVIDFNGKGWFERLFSHTTPSEVIKSEMKAAGYRLEREFDFRPRQHFIVFASTRK
jgi:arsenite methyltransferase